MKHAPDGTPSEQQTITYPYYMCDVSQPRKRQLAHAEAQARARREAELRCAREGSQGEPAMNEEIGRAGYKVKQNINYKHCACKIVIYGAARTMDTAERMGGVLMQVHHCAAANKK